MGTVHRARPARVRHSSRGRRTPTWARWPARRAPGRAGCTPASCASCRRVPRRGHRRGRAAAAPRRRVVHLAWGAAVAVDGGTWRSTRSAPPPATGSIRAGWPTTPPGCCAAAARRADRSRALSRADVERLLTRDDIASASGRSGGCCTRRRPVRPRCCGSTSRTWTCRTARRRCAARAARSTSIVWQTGTARLLPRLLKGRKTGPVFLTDRRARVELPPGDIDQASGRARLSYRQAEDLFKAASGGATLHQLRHSALTHDAEDGASTPMLMAKSGHTSVASLARYARPSAEALARWQERNDPARRR